MSTLTNWLSPQAAQVDDTKRSRFYHQLTNCLIVAGIILLTVNSARIVYRSIYSEVPFVDEIVLIKDYANFFMAFGNGVGRITQLGFWVHGS